MTIWAKEHCKLRSTFLSKSHFSFGFFYCFLYKLILKDYRRGIQRNRLLGSYLACCSLIPLSLKSIMWTGSSSYCFLLYMVTTITPNPFQCCSWFTDHAVFQKNTNHHTCGLWPSAEHNRRKYDLLVIFNSNYQIRAELRTKFFL